MTFKAPDSLAEQIAHHLAERIIRGELKERERIQEQKVTQTLNVSRGSVREALLILERRHLVNILPRRGAQVSELSPQHVESLYALIVQLYILLAESVARRWRSEAELAPFLAIQQRLLNNLAQSDIDGFVEASFDIMRAAFPFANNPYLQGDCRKPAAGGESRLPPGAGAAQGGNEPVPRQFRPAPASGDRP